MAILKKLCIIIATVIFFMQPCPNRESAVASTTNEKQQLRQWKLESSTQVHVPLTLAGTIHMYRFRPPLISDASGSHSPMEKA